MKRWKRLGRARAAIRYWPSGVRRSPRARFGPGSREREIAKARRAPPAHSATSVRSDLRTSTRSMCSHGGGGAGGGGGGGSSGGGGGGWLGHRQAASASAARLAAARHARGS